MLEIFLSTVQVALQVLAKAGFIISVKGSELAAFRVPVRLGALNLLAGCSQMVRAWASPRNSNSLPRSKRCYAVYFLISLQMMLRRALRKRKAGSAANSRVSQSRPVYVEHPQTTGETRKRLHRRSIKAAHEYWIHTRSISSFSWQGSEGRLCCDGGGAARVFLTHFLHGSPL